MPIAYGIGKEVKTSIRLVYRNKFTKSVSYYYSRSGSTWFIHCKKHTLVFHGEVYVSLGVDYATLSCSDHQPNNFNLAYWK
jgi:hypothetical protein